MTHINDTTKWIGKESYYYDTISSTNTKARELAQKGCSHGTIILAEEQEAGVGRRGRSWSSSKGDGIYMSIVLRPDISPEQSPMLTLVTALAVAKAILTFSKASNVIPFIKWPNDIVLRGKKVCGILTELILQKNVIDYVVIGVGINVHNSYFPSEIADTATSLELELGHGVARERLVEQVLQEFEKCYELFLQAGDLQLLKEDYQRLSANKGREVCVLDPHGEYRGIAKGITDDGELVVETKEGTRLVSGGEVSVRGIYGYV